MTTNFTTVASTCDPVCDQEADSLRQDPRAGLALIFARNQHRLGWTIRLRLDPSLRRRIDGEDILQEAYVVASQRIHEYLEAPEVPVFVWLRCIVCQTIVDTHRRHLRSQIRTARRDVSIDDVRLDSTTLTLAELLEESLTSPSGVVQRWELARQLQAALESLDPVDREVLVLRHFEDLSNKEVAAALQIKSTSACMRYKRAMQRLRKTIRAWEWGRCRLNECEGAHGADRQDID